MNDMMNTSVTPEMLQEKDREINELNDTITEQERKLKRHHRVSENGRFKSNGDLISKIRDLKRPIAMRYVFSQSSKDTPMSLDLGECFKNYLNDVFEKLDRFMSRYGKIDTYEWVGPDEYKYEPIEDTYDGLSQQELADELSKKDAIISDKKETIAMFNEFLDEVDQWERFKYRVRRTDSDLVQIRIRVEKAANMKMDLELAEWYRNAFFTTVDYLYKELDLKEACEEFREFM